MMYDGTDWRYMGPRGITAGLAHSPSIAALSDGTPW